MVKTIGNPLSWSADAVGATGSHIGAASERIGGARSTAPPIIRDIGLEDIRAALQSGVEDFMAMRSDVMFMVLLYPIIGLVLALGALNANFAPYLFPLATGFALVGPLAAVFLYELSRRREMGLPTGWANAFELVRSPAMAPIAIMGLYLLVVFVVWMMVANLIYAFTLGTNPHATVGAFLSDVFTTTAGWAMIVLGVGVGFLFASLVLAISVVSFPLLIDRDVGVPVAIVTSVQLTKRNPRTVATWGLLVACSLFLGSIPLFLGLIVVLPILGHATWHLYRRAIG